MPPLADTDNRGRWPLICLVIDSVLFLALVAFWLWIGHGVYDAWRATPPDQRAARAFGFAVSLALAATVVAFLWWLDRASPLRRNAPTFPDPSNTRRPGGAGTSARVVDESQAPPVAGGRRFQGIS